jgi:hypothetical protein
MSKNVLQDALLINTIKKIYISVKEEEKRNRILDYNEV